MIREVLPENVYSSESFSDVPESTAFPEELSVLSHAVHKRQREFVTVRHCARQALSDIGFPPTPIVPGGDRVLQWPDGLVGAMTHCAGYRAAAVAKCAEFAAIGIDAERNEPLVKDLFGMIARPEEQKIIPTLGDELPSVCWERLLFSAKESAYKAWFPVSKEWLRFKDISIDIDPESSLFHTNILTRYGALWSKHEFHGRWLVRDGLIITAITCPTNT